ncbi:FMN-dependent NADH-azoreductase [Nannocystis punicea]|uniref:FMN dependent NADH:quinone oxidoreductase n=1 Tax=Nannocystis punicea TaxID=2995304 RepID=A0ABY7HBA9_9BACT|nr:NAD(P)H-dependent oxidoreductase [Nannocystis poenicansa]WAS96553.1 NAD(P)H-dependent oxidoreductase [Nannocystis poenicansa]
MHKLLVVDASGRVTRSVTRRLTRRFTEVWRAHEPGGTVLRRDVGLDPPPPVDEPWIAAAFADPAARSEAGRAALRASDALIDELEAADAVVIGAPMYNFGMPAQLKAYFDQVIRVGRAFGFDAAAAEPYRPLLRARPVVVITSVGDGALNPGGALAHLNFLEPHLATCLGFIGLTDVTFVRIGFDEFQDGRFRASIAAAEAEVDALAAALAAGPVNCLAS